MLARTINLRRVPTALPKPRRAILTARPITTTTTSPSRSAVHPSSSARPALGTPRVASSLFAPLDTFPSRHLGPRDTEISHMLDNLGYASLDAFVDDVVPRSIRVDELDNEPGERGIVALSESELMRRAGEMANKNKVLKGFIGMGYHNAVMPAVVQRNILENPAWYTSYTPYQPEISQGRLESLLNFQTLVTSLTALPIANASLLDEATAAAEAMTMSFNHSKAKKPKYLVDRGVYPQTLAVLKTRAAPAGIDLVVTNLKSLTEFPSDACGALIQYPERRGDVADWAHVVDLAHSKNALVTCATDLLALTKLKPPGEWGCDIAVGNSARFGVPIGFGGPHAAFFAVSNALTRKIPGRLIGVSKDADGKLAYRLTLQTREQHIRRDKALSNVCTAQALLANLAAFYALYHGPHGLRRIADKVHSLTRLVAAGVERLSHEVVNKTYFDRITVGLNGVAAKVVGDEAVRRGLNFRIPDEGHVGITLDESHTLEDVKELLNLFVDLSPSSRRRAGNTRHYTTDSLLELADGLGLDRLGELASSVSIAASSSAPLEGAQGWETDRVPEGLKRTSGFLEHEVFNKYHSETEMMRYMYELQGKDLSLVDSMIPLGSCTMKLNSASSMMPLTWKEFGSLHPFAPLDQSNGYRQIVKELTKDLCKITGFPAVSLQPNSGAQGEYAGLSVIRAWHHERGDRQRDVCLVPLSAHGTNPASAVMAGMRVVTVKTTATGTLDLEDLRAKAEKHKDVLAAVMITYPSTFGVFEEGVQEACEIVHANGGQVYLDGANMNAQIGLTNPAKCGADVCHLNLHKTFGIPHGGGGPGVGPIGVAAHLAPYLPGHPFVKTGGTKAINAVTSAPWGSASILTISWAYVKMLGGAGVTLSSKLSLLNANYMAMRLKDHYELKYTNAKGLCAHEFILDFAEFDKKAGIKVMDVAKRLIDFGFHPPTCSWPISTAMLIEPTESENLAEIDRFCDAMIVIRGEIAEIEAGHQSRDDNVIKRAPHPIHNVLVEDGEWKRPYSRAQAAYPVESLRSRKFWPSVSRIDDAYGDVNLFCTCPSPSSVGDSS